MKVQFFDDSGRLVTTLEGQQARMAYAAPELLSALIALAELAVKKGVPRSHLHMANARDAIAKATAA